MRKYIFQPYLKQFNKNGHQFYLIDTLKGQGLSKVLIQNHFTKQIQLVLIMILASSFLADGIMTASAQQGSIHDQPCTASVPCQKICGDHVCSPGEVYPLVSDNT